MTLSRFLSNMVKAHPGLQDLQSMLLALELSCKTISNMVHRTGLAYSVSSTSDTTAEGFGDGRYYSMKRLDKLSTSVLKNALQFTGTVQMLAPYVKKQTQMDPSSASSVAEATDGSNQKPQKASAHQPGVLIVYDDNFVSCLDPLDGSGNADASICTGTVFGVYPRDKSNDKADIISTLDPTDFDTPTVHPEEDLLRSVLKPARNMKAAGYCLYSSSTVLVFSIADVTATIPNSNNDNHTGEYSGIFGFTLDPQLEEFVLTHHPWTIPKRGNVYSCNEANSEGWDKEGPWWKYLQRLKWGTGESQSRYSHRYVGSMVGDIHRTLLYGGMFAYPAEQVDKPQGNLQLLYKSAPMAFLIDQAGGKSIDDKGRDLLDISPTWIHHKVPCFMGSPQDVDELKTFIAVAGQGEGQEKQSSN
eukprot:Nitzschia sp. Nitz4//scaffold108_size72880//19653//20900//NITZ4_005809-RA/size72880-processed-gene-0.48-mRNA-1//-1//CDS//3329532651//7698//frame0